MKKYTNFQYWAGILIAAALSSIITSGLHRSGYFNTVVSTLEEKVYKEAVVSGWSGHFCLLKRIDYSASKKGYIAKNIQLNRIEKISDSSTVLTGKECDPKLEEPPKGRPPIYM